MALLSTAGSVLPVAAHAGEVALAGINAAQLSGADEGGVVTQPGAAWTAEIVRPVIARAAPSRDASARATVQPYGLGIRPRMLLATRGFRDVHGHDWVRVQLNIRPNHTTAWIPADAVLLAPITIRVLVHLNSRRLDVWQNSHRVLSVPAGIGRSATPTPTGRFAIDDMWETDATTRPMYGRFVLALTAHSNVLMRFDGGDGRVAIHGGGSPARVGARSSFGCIIVSEHVLVRMWKLLRPGTPVTILAD